jgi:hypothetical protein
MPTELRIIKITTLKKFTDFVERNLSIPNVIAWYRGCGKAAYKLIPSLYRHPKVTIINELLLLENNIISRFKQRSVPYLHRALTNDWEYLFFMQHTGIPTRLLDWTENPYIALYFALTAAHYKIERNIIKYTEDAAVWVFNPIEWNKRSLQHIGFEGRILSPLDQELKGYTPASEISLMNSEPVAIYGTHNSPRIVAQRGVFTIFGKNVNSIEEVYQAMDFPRDSLVKLIFPKTHIEKLLKSIISIGYSDSVLFPDLDGLAKETKRFFEFEV